MTEKAPGSLFEAQNNGQQVTELERQKWRDMEDIFGYDSQRGYNRDNDFFVVTKGFEGDADATGEASKFNLVLNRLRFDSTRERSNGQWLVEDGYLEVNGQSVPLQAIMPPEYKMYVGAVEPAAMIESKEVQMSRLDSPTDFSFLLHEIGHASDFEDNNRKPVVALQVHQMNKHELDKIKEVMPELVTSIAQQERSAWAYALKIARNNNIPLTKMIKGAAEEALIDYDKNNAFLTGRGSSRNTFASNEQRKRMQSPEKVLEVKYLEAISLRVHDLLSHLEEATNQAQVKRQFEFSFTTNDKLTYKINRIRSEIRSVKITREELLESGETRIDELTVDGSSFAILVSKLSNADKPEYQIMLSALSNRKQKEDLSTFISDEANYIFDELNEISTREKMQKAFQQSAA